MTPEHLATLRKTMDLTQEDMATWIGLSKRAYSDLETGKTPVRLIHTLAIERAALTIAVQENNPMLCPVGVRKEALELARMITG